MEELKPDELLDAVAATYKFRRYAVGSLWWFSENIFRNAYRIESDSWNTNKVSHPGTFLISPRSYEFHSGRTLIHAGRTPKLGYENKRDIIVELNPTMNPGKLTKFAGRKGFIGQVRREDLLQLPGTVVSHHIKIGYILTPN
jgi:hypothetical protein